MSDIAIKVENLGKSYLVGHNAAQAESYTTLRDVFARNARHLARKTRDMFQGKAIIQGDEVEEFWALRDVNFEIKQGDRVGIIGRNGAGKSTLLKILSRITEPTTGRVSINGRVASLLEVGTGFHPELTGRENIFLNGAILGMSRQEIQRKFDEIVDFAEVEKFLDTPVKRYSSGMYVRLAFAVAAHLEPEILVVDEVLAVGDAQFQKKCLGKMEEVGNEGRTVIFVSHNEFAIRRLCSSAVLLKGGHSRQFATTTEAFQNYKLASQYSGFSDKKRIHSSSYIKIQNAWIDQDGAKANTVEPGKTINLYIEINSFDNLQISFELLLRDENLQPIMFGSAGLAYNCKFQVQNGLYTISFKIDPLRLAAGKYSIDLMIVDSGVRFYDYLEDAIVFNCQPEPNKLTGWVFRQSGAQGAILLEIKDQKITKN
jgi:lipopolysaccharide transport system ATP-binding protein